MPEFENPEAQKAFYHTEIKTGTEKLQKLVDEDTFLDEEHKDHVIEFLRRAATLQEDPSEHSIPFLQGTLDAIRKNVNLAQLEGEDREMIIQARDYLGQMRGMDDEAWKELPQGHSDNELERLVDYFVAGEPGQKKAIQKMLSERAK